MRQRLLRCKDYDCFNNRSWWLGIFYRNNHWFGSGRYPSRVRKEHLCPLSRPIGRGSLMLLLPMSWSIRSRRRDSAADLAI
ncbi:uncharacterized protein P174DRAFT_130089 [Aspergillus novofumigatus IBT 16806]|uniref:Uncharacterized protein n=1 Tax=Aspergillus novofumigatus (strain IBT 16806) TaxID=1392255 RepID=A0A2I1CCE2_ASPN1|nr:uncharacterized protein P174DRAFT_130089 [Aspergillus novofumigatus IBT 16806]PKX95290.1 hypothetical protein P174DRAFT_130089 [Aspergillus novofumigatus IBT 16806]